jgi:hypothetical protein
MNQENAFDGNECGKNIQSCHPSTTRYTIAELVHCSKIDDDDGHATDVCFAHGNPTRQTPKRTSTLTILLHTKGKFRIRLLLLSW